ncbi:MAG: C4-dicarboxylate ABC transporter permease [Deltaproteobacteria bacterium]|nr:MAG: C4-dicarboxylate ABC transporter permease [Deltaproteobacteria bacterium]
MIAVLFLAFFILLLLGLPVAISLGVASLASLYFGSHIPFLILPQKIFNGINSFPFMAIPLFLLAGNIMAEAKISDKLVGLASLLVGRYPGGLAHITTGSSAFFGAISGSAPATTAAIGSIMIPSMVKRNYSRSYSAAIVAASGALGLIIPPSLTMVVFGVIAGASIGELFICGIVPGLLLVVSIIVLNYRIAKKQGFEGEKEILAKNRFVVIKDSFLALLMPFIILGGIYSGVFTATESAGVACLYGVVIGMFVFRTLSLRALFSTLKNTAENSALIMFLMGTANLFGFIITSEQVPQNLASFIIGFTDNQYVVMSLILLMLLVIGTFLDNVAALVLFVPSMLGVINTLDINLTYFGVFTVIALSVGQFTPPVGLNLFIACNIAEERLEYVVKAIIPYFLLYMFALILFIFFPKLLTAFI